MGMKIALINCPMWDVEFTPYNIALLSAVLKQHDLEADCFDLNREFYFALQDKDDLWHLNDLYAFWQSPAEIRALLRKKSDLIADFIERLKPYQIIGFSVQSLNFTFTIDLAAMIKERFPEKIIIVGGPECFRNFNPEYLFKHDCFDALCCGEAEEALPELIGKIIKSQELYTAGFFIKQNNGIIDCGARVLLQNLDSLPFADYSFLDKKTKNISISTSRGCICNCTFCHEKAHWDKYRYRSAKSVFDELRALKKTFPLLEFVYLNDSLINGNLKEFMAFCDLMVSGNLGIQWGGHALIREGMDADFLKTMKQAGAQRINFGVESGSDHVLKLMNKSFNSSLAFKVLEEMKKTGISFSVNLIVGYPGETPEDFEKTRRIYRRVKELTECVHVNPCLILRGSQLYKNAERLGIVLPENYINGWFLKDGTNDLEARTKRTNSLIKAS